MKKGRSCRPRRLSERTGFHLVTLNGAQLEEAGSGVPSRGRICSYNIEGGHNDSESTKYNCMMQILDLCIIVVSLRFIGNSLLGHCEGG